MTTYNPANVTDNLVSSPNRTVHVGYSAVTAALALNDVVNVCRVPAGTIVDRVVIRHSADMDTNVSPGLVVKIGFAGINESLASGADTAVGSGVTTWQGSAASTTYEVFPPYHVKKDSYLQAVATTAAATGAAATIYGKVEGEFVGAK